MIRHAQLADLPQVLKLLHAYFAEWNIEYREDASAVEAALTHPSLGYFLAELDGSTAGCVLLRPLPDLPSAAECKRLYVLPEARGHGIAGKLMDTIETHARNTGLDWLYLDSKAEFTTAIAMYHRRGYEEIPRFNDNAEATIFFRKRLTQ